MSRLQTQPAKKTVRLGRVTLGAGMPKICVPVMGKSFEDIRAAAVRAKAADADVIELRIDSLNAQPDAETAIAACRAVRGAAGEIPLLLTMRTQRDGGAGSTDAEAYEAILTAAAKARVCEAIDCELSAGETAFRRIVHAAHEAGIAVVGSSHEFGEIGNMERAAKWLQQQAALGADIVKAAVMTRTNEEAMTAALTMMRAGEKLGVPMIAIAMGPAGVLTRIGGACMGSCMTFGTAGEASAPGQVDARALRQILEIIQSTIS